MAWLVKPGDDLEAWAREWSTWSEHGRFMAVGYHRKHLKELAKDPVRLKEYLSLHTELLAAIARNDKYPRNHVLSFTTINRVCSDAEAGEAFGLFLKRAAIAAAVGLGIYVAFGVINGKRTPDYVLRQMHPFDPADDPRSDENGYEVRGR